MNYGKIILNNEDFTPSEKKGEQAFCIRVAVRNLDDGRVDCIEAVIPHEPTTADYNALTAAYVEDLKRDKLNAILKHDVSEHVNIFEIGGVLAWLDKATRVGLRNSLTVEKEVGHENTTLYLNGHAIILPVETALSMLDTLELYAIDCYRQTEAHKVAVSELSTIDDVKNYDYTAGYPEHPVFVI